MSGPLAGRRIGLLTASASRQGGGVFEAVVAQARLIDALGGEAQVFALEDADTGRDRARLGEKPVHAFAVRGPRQIGYSPQLLPALLAAELDLLHLHGIWMYPSRAGALWAKSTGRAYIVSPHGMLDPWITARGRWKKSLARLVYERASWAAAWVLHGLTGAEAADIARETARSDTLVIPNAGPEVEPAQQQMPPPVFAYLGRIHTKKNLLSLIEGWNAARRPPEARLRIAGWGDEAHVEQLKAAVSIAGESVEFLGPLFGEAKAALIAGARFMVLPSHSEGLPMAMLEAWAARRPTLMTTHCNLPEGFAAGAALDCGTDARAITLAIEAALSLGAAEWQARSQAARSLAAGPFAAGAVAARWGEAYARAIAKEGPR